MSDGNKLGEMMTKAKNGDFVGVTLSGPQIDDLTKEVDAAKKANKDIDLNEKLKDTLKRILSNLIAEPDKKENDGNIKKYIGFAHSVGMTDINRESIKNDGSKIDDLVKNIVEAYPNVEVNKIIDMDQKKEPPATATAPDTGPATAPTPDTEPVSATATEPVSAPTTDSHQSNATDSTKTGGGRRTRRRRRYKDNRRSRKRRNSKRKRSLKRRRRNRNSRRR